jgi:hypothetical protein
MLLLTLILQLAIIGLCLYLVERFVPMDPVIALAIRILVVLAVVIYLLRIFGVWDLVVPLKGAHGVSGALGTTIAGRVGV